MTHPRQSPPGDAKSAAARTRCAAIVTAAGVSGRMGGSGKKEYRMLSGIPVLVRSILPFLHAGCRVPIIVVVPQGDIPRASALLDGRLPPDSVRFVEGGPTRQESVFHALSELSKDPPSLVLIHDGARPWVTEELILGVEEAAGRDGACIPVTRPTEAVKRVDGSGTITESIPRESLAMAQTPQGFRFAEIYAAHEKALRDGRHGADDAELYAAYEGVVSTIPGDAANRKITFAHDLQDGAAAEPDDPSGEGGGL